MLQQEDSLAQGTWCSRGETVPSMGSTAFYILSTSWPADVFLGAMLHFIALSAFLAFYVCGETLMGS